MIIKYYQFHFTCMVSDFCSWVICPYNSFLLSLLCLTKIQLEQSMLASTSHRILYSLLLLIFVSEFILLPLTLFALYVWYHSNATSQVEHCYTWVNCNDSWVILCILACSILFLSVLSTCVVYSQVAHVKCLHKRVPYTDMPVPYTLQWPQMVYLYKDITNKQKLQNITHLCVYPTHP